MIPSYDYFVILWLFCHRGASFSSMCGCFMKKKQKKTNFILYLFLSFCSALALLKLCGSLTVSGK